MSLMSARPLATISAVASISQTTPEWVNAETYSGSVSFMKQLTVIAISTIVNMNNLFPEESFTTETFGGMSLKLLKIESRDESAQYVSTALVHAMEALEKKFMAKLVLCLYSGSCETGDLVAAYSFEFSYSDGGVSMSVRSGGEPARRVLRERTLELLRACCAAAELSRIQESVTAATATNNKYDVALLIYYNDDAPSGYQAQGFSPVEAGGELKVEAALAAAGDLGTVRTPYHGLIARAHLREATDRGHPRPQLYDVRDTRDVRSSMYDSQDRHDVNYLRDPCDLPSSREVNASLNIPVMTQDDSDENQEHDESHVKLRCACQMRDGDSPRAPCRYCGALQHLECYGLLEMPPARRVCCLPCWDAAPARAATCPRLVCLAPIQRKSLCLMRRTLMWLRSAGAGPVSARGLVARLGLASQAWRMLVHLADKHVLAPHPRSLDSLLTINRKNLELLINSEFQFPESTVVDRLLAEGLSREPRSQPTPLARVVQHTPPETHNENTTLDQYRQATLACDTFLDEELPLSGSHNPVQHIGKTSTVHKRPPTSPKKQTRLMTKKAKQGL